MWPLPKYEPLARWTSRLFGCSGISCLKASILALLAAWCLVAPPLALAAEEIAPPFGLKWGINREQLNGLLKGANAKVVEKRVLSGRDMWTVTGLSQPNLHQTIFYFRNDGLVEVELQYQNSAWLDEDYNKFMSQLRQSLEAKYGTGKLIARSKNPQGDVLQTLTGYEWVQTSNAIQLVYFSAESPSQVFRMVSLHYKAL